MATQLDTCVSRPELSERGRAAFLRRNNDSYEALLRLLFDRQPRNCESWMRCLQTLAEFCQFNHPGRFADGALENFALEIGGDLEAIIGRCAPLPDMPAFANDSRRHVLHITSCVLEIGGHTRTIRNWIELDSESRHSVLVLNQDAAPVPAWIKETVGGSGGALIVFPNEASLLEKAGWLRRLVRTGPDLVVLHTFGHDSVCPVALANRDGPPVALVNHADHIFWMGGSVADMIVNQRRIGMEWSEERRYARNNVVLPVPLRQRPRTSSRREARTQLGIPQDQVVLLSVGRACKYIPTGRHNFVRAAGEILDRDPTAHLYLVGVSRPDLEGTFESDPHDRLHFVGPVPDASPYQQVADVYLEGFPFGSQTALLEAAMAGVAVVRAFAPPLALLASNDDSLDDLAPIPASEEEYVYSACDLVRDRGRRDESGAELRRSVLASHTGDGWRENLNEIYSVAEGLQHRARPVPRTACEWTAVDIGLSAWQAEKEGELGSADSSRKICETLYTAAYHVRCAGDFRKASLLLSRCLRISGFNARYAMAFLKLMPQKFMQAGQRA